MGLPTKGTLSELDFIALLETAAADKLTGMVRLETGSLIKVVYLQQGTIAFASSNEKSDRLTEVLRHAGKLTAEQIEHAQSRLRPNVSLGKTLVELGYVSPKDLLWGARMQVEGIVHQLLYWEHGTFQIVEGPLPKEIVSLNLSIPHVIFDGILKTHDRQWVLQHIGSPDAIYTIASDFHEKNVTYKLPVEEIVSRMNGKRSLEQIADAAGKDTFEVCKTAVALEKLKLVQRIKEKPVQMHLVALPSAGDEFPEELKGMEPEESDVSFDQPLQFRNGEQSEVPQQKIVTEQPLLVDEDEEIPAGTLQLLSAPGEIADEAPPIRPEPDQTKIPPGIPGIQEAPAPMESFGGMESEDPEENRQGIWWKIAVALAALALLGIAGYYWFTRTNRITNDASKNLSSQTTQEPSQPQNSTPPVNNPASVPEPDPNKPASNDPVPLNATDASDPLALAKSGKLQEAAQAWKNALSRQKGKLTLQLEIACQEKTVQDALSILQDSSQLLIVPMTYKGQTCYRVLYGTYASVEEAEKIRNALPPDFLHQKSPPQIMAVSRILQ